MSTARPTGAYESGRAGYRSEGRRRNLKSLSIQTAKKYAVITIDALRSLCGFDPRSRNSSRSHLLLSVPAECAVVSVAHSKPSNRLRGCV